MRPALDDEDPACSSSRRSRAAHDAPPATPPTMMTFMGATSQGQVTG
jgi:hypothetical protein